ncbi:mitochondrial PGP phosphatase-domain-containing protein [Russula compacta]|nr:mitochondrial PGP phosphatase-domain-containing protein [Russula compacta]
MPFNLPGTLAPLYALLSPRLLLPSLAVRDIRYLNFVALRDAGYRGAIFDKDNCLTLPHSDKLVPELETAWSEALQVFGPSHILVVSNSAGTRDDAAQLQAESVAYHLRAPILLHAALKPSYACAAATLSALPTLAPHELIVVGDRIFTDVVLAHRLAHPCTLVGRIAARLGLSRPGSDDSGSNAGSSPSAGAAGEPMPAAPLAVWTTGVWTRESMAMRCVEACLVQLVERWVQGARERKDALEERFVRRTLDRGNGNGSGAHKAERGWFSWVKRVRVRVLPKPKLA